ncbi:MAG: hypothetical protein ACTSVI_11140 [Promethearchaeota archaeon]
MKETAQVHQAASISQSLLRIDHLWCLNFTSSKWILLLGLMAILDEKKPD